MTAPIIEEATAELAAAWRHRRFHRVKLAHAYGIHPDTLDQWLSRAGIRQPHIEDWQRSRGRWVTRRGGIRQWVRA